MASRLSKASRSIAGRTNDKPERALRHVIMARQSVRLRTLMPMMRWTEGHGHKKTEHKGDTKHNAVRSSALYQDGDQSNLVASSCYYRYFLRLLLLSWQAIRDCCPIKGWRQEKPPAMTRIPKLQCENIHSPTLTAASGCSTPRRMISECHRGP